MPIGHEDCYIVYLRSDRSLSQPPEVAERLVVVCTSYGEARRIQRLLHRAEQECVIRYEGDTGGGD